MEDCDDLPLGYKFEPSKEQLVGYFLKTKLIGEPLESCYKDVIIELDVYSDHPSNIMSLTNIKVEEDSFQQGYFFSSLKKTSKNGKRINRVIPTHGTWQEKAATKKVFVQDDIGIHKYYKFNPFPEYKGSKLNKDEWMMHEYSIPVPCNQNDINMVLCHITNKKDSNKSIKACKIINTAVDQSLDCDEAGPSKRTRVDSYNTGSMDDVLSLISYDVEDKCADHDEGVYNESFTLFENGYQHAMQEVIVQEDHGGQVIGIPAGEMVPLQAANELTRTTSSFDPSTQEELNRLLALLMS